jgi:hypothetical protein
MQIRRGIQAETIGDYFDFQQPIPQIDSYNADLKAALGIRENDLVITHATRITGHKVIENALLFACELEKHLHAAAPLALACRMFEKDSRVVILFPNFVEPEAEEYFQNLKAYQDSLGVTAFWASEHFLPERITQDGRKIYSFWDSYVIADLVTYTSIQEGFGNQLLEAIYFKKVPVILEYPVFEKDLQHEGYQYISLGKSRELARKDGLRLTDSIKVQTATQRTTVLLQDPSKIRKLVDKNFKIAQSYHDVALLRDDLQKFLKLLS